jgi:hypothetical protein
MITVYTGFDAREEVGWHAFTSSVMHGTTESVAFVPVSGPQRDGSNTFTAARFLVPFLQRYEGWAIFADACDMICTGDIGELWKLADPKYAVMVVPHRYDSRHPRKFVGTQMESPNVGYPRKNQASLMLINCGHPAWKSLLPTVCDMPARDLLEFKFLDDALIGELPAVWNWLVDEYGENPDAKILHWTAGIPAFPAYAEAPMADLWAAAALKAQHATP